MSKDNENEHKGPDNTTPKKPITEILGDPELIFNVTGTTRGDGFYMNFDNKTAKVSSSIKRKEVKYELMPFEDGGGLVQQISRKQIRVYRFSPAEFATISQRIYEILKPEQEKKRVVRQSKSLMRSYAKHGGGDRSGFGLFVGKERIKNENGEIIITKIPRTAYILALEFLRISQDRETEKNEEGYFKLPSLREVCRGAGIDEKNHKFLLEWFRVLDRIQIPLVTKLDNNRISVENHKLCQIRYHVRDAKTGTIEKGIVIDDKLLTDGKEKPVIEAVWIKLDDKLLREIEDAPEGFAYALVTDDYAWVLQNLSFYAAKLSSYVFSMRDKTRVNEDNLIAALGMEEVRSKQGLKKTQEIFTKAFDDLLGVGHILTWSRDTGARGQVVYTWTRENYGAGGGKIEQKGD